MLGIYDSLFTWQTPNYTDQNPSKIRLSEAAEEPNTWMRYARCGIIYVPDDPQKRLKQEGESGYLFSHAHPYFKESDFDLLGNPLLLLLLYLRLTDQLDVDRFWREELAVPEQIASETPKRKSVVKHCQGIMNDVYEQVARRLIKRDVELWRDWRSTYFLLPKHQGKYLTSYELWSKNPKAYFKLQERQKKKKQKGLITCSLPFQANTRLSPPSALGDQAYTYFKAQFAYASVFGNFKRIFSHQGYSLFYDDGFFRALAYQIAAQPGDTHCFQSKSPFILGEESAFNKVKAYVNRGYLLEQRINAGRRLMSHSLGWGIGGALIGGFLALPSVGAITFAALLTAATPVGWGLAGLFLAGALIRLVANHQMTAATQALKKEIESRNTNGLCGLFPILPHGETVPASFDEMRQIEPIKDPDATAEQKALAPLKALHFYAQHLRKDYRQEQPEPTRSLAAPGGNPV